MECDYTFEPVSQTNSIHNTRELELHTPPLQAPNIREIDSYDRSIALCIIGLLFASYLFTYTGLIDSSDGLAMFATAESMVRRGEIDSNQLIWMGNQQGNFGPDGDLYSRKGLGMVLLTVPLVWLARLWPGLGLVHVALLLNPILTAWTGGLLFRTGRRLGWGRATSTAVALLFGLATLAWPYAQSFFSDPVSAWGLFAAFYGLLGYSQTARKRYLLLGGMAWSIAYLARVINLATLPIYAAGLLIAIFAAAPVERPDRAALPRPTSWRDGLRSLFSDHWRPLVSFVVPVVVAGFVSLWWNWARYGSVWDSGYVESERFNGVWWFGIYGLLIGPSRGLLWYSPVLLLALPSLRPFWRQARQARYVLFFCVAIWLLYVLLYAKWYMWHGGYSWGPRFLIPLLPFAALLIGPTWHAWVETHRLGLLGRMLVWALVLVSVGVQWLGLLIPFQPVQDWLAGAVTPLFAPETFTQLRYSPLLLQWQFLTPDNIHLAWWRGMAGVDWQALLLALIGVLVGIILLAAHLRRAHSGQRVPDSYGILYTGMLAVITLALLSHYYVSLTDAELVRAANRIQQTEIIGDKVGDAIVMLLPLQSQAFANVYHGQLPVYGFLPQGSLDSPEEAWLTTVRTRHGRLWLLPDSALPEESGWERALRSDDFLLFDTRMSAPDGQRLALYALSEQRPLQEAGLGTIFGDPALVDQEIDSDNGWFRLEGYGLTPETQAGDELLVALRWESLRSVDYNYQVFVHLLNANGEMLAQRDGQPVQWMRPTSTWQAGEEIVDRYALLLPNDLPQGSYSIAVGLYDPESGQRLPVSAGPRDYAIELGPILVTSNP